jgi:uncharacterized protein YdeI (YjbR/CyaY-like superfamily)
MHGFKDYCALLFMKGALMADPQHILVQQTPHVQAARQIRFTSAQQIRDMESAIRAYVADAIAVEKSGQQVPMKATSEFAVPEELDAAFATVPGLQDAFESLTPGRQRGYLLYFAAPKLSATRESRIEKCIDRIMDGMGLQD